MTALFSGEAGGDAVGRTGDAVGGQLALPEVIMRGVMFGGVLVVGDARVVCVAVVEADVETVLTAFSKSRRTPFIVWDKGY